MREIEITLDQIYQPKIEKFDDFNKSLFYSAYNKATCLIGQEIERKRSYKEGYIKQDINNIIAFVGGRGVGKSSALFSFLNFLENDSKKLFPNNKKVRFIALKPIDATMLEDNENTLDAVLARMVEKCVELESNYPLKCNMIKETENLHNLQMKLHKLSNSLQQEEPPSILDMNQHLNSVTEVLNRQSRVGQAIQELCKIVKEMEEMYGEESIQPYVVVTLDDIDMHPQAFQIIESIRKNLMVSNLIVFLSINYDQLLINCQKHFYEEFIGNNIMPSLSNEHRKQMIWKAEKLTEEYLKKFLPPGKMLYIPGINSEYGKENRIRVHIPNLDITSKDLSVKQAILGIILYYTGIPFDGTERKNHYLEPNTIRDLSNLTAELNLLLPLKDGDLEEIYENNMKWFYRNIVQQLFLKLNYSFDKKLINDFLETENEKKNYCICKSVRFEDRSIELIPGDSFKNRFDQYLKFLHQYSMGDLIAALRYMKKRSQLSEIVVQIIQIQYSELVCENWINQKLNKKNWKTEFWKLTKGDIFGYYDYIMMPQVKIRNNSELSINKEDNIEQNIFGRHVGIDLEKPLFYYVLEDQTRQYTSEAKIAYEICRLFITPYKSWEIDPRIMRQELPKDSVTKVGNKRESLNFLLDSNIYNMQEDNFIRLPIIEQGTGFYSITNWIANIYVFEEILTEAEDKWNKKYPNQQSSLLEEMREWKEKYNTCAILPFYSLDFLCNLAEFIKEQMTDFQLNVLKNHREYGKIFVRVFQIIGEKIKELTQFYTEPYGNSFLRYNYFEIYKNCPLIKHLGIYEMKLTELKDPCKSEKYGRLYRSITTLIYITCRDSVDFRNFNFKDIWDFD